MPSVSKGLREQVSLRANRCCEYCKTQQLLIGMPLVVDHVMPTARDGENTFGNLAASCYRCNQFKGVKIFALDPLSGEEVDLFNPRTRVWFEHFCWTEEGLYISGISAIGRATVEALRLNNVYVTASRKIWILEGWHPPHFQDMQN